MPTTVEEPASSGLGVGSGGIIGDERVLGDGGGYLRQAGHNPWFDYHFHLISQPIFTTISYSGLGAEIGIDFSSTEHLQEHPLPLSPPLPHTADHPQSTRSMAVATAKCIARPPADPCSPKQWARTNLPTKATGYPNPGWPSCCHPPVPSEHCLIQPTDWRSISIVHHIPIPPDIKATLDGLCPAIPQAPTKHAPDRKASLPMSKSPAMPPKSPAMPIPPKPRCSPKQGTASLSNSLSCSMPLADKPGTLLSNMSSPYSGCNNYGVDGQQQVMSFRSGYREALDVDICSSIASWNASPSYLTVTSQDTDRSGTIRFNEAFGNTSSPEEIRSAPWEKILKHLQLLAMDRSLGSGGVNSGAIKGRLCLFLPPQLSSSAIKPHLIPRLPSAIKHRVISILVLCDGELGSGSLMPRKLDSKVSLSNCIWHYDVTRPYYFGHCYVVTKGEAVKNSQHTSVEVLELGTLDKSSFGAGVPHVRS
ncbi:hypothetical protein EDD18DRAFT_1106596 [Armillaria luteobubalina]|uniref:Uncharacterized protein n=1 Tax=Armillaria luteobubalina TaxID=153913 RepID=A0AA39Q359_9AGAR|nr:hypothetical protein EDD18DRAFT_1106596 [Armillaria luteobubalina]